MSIQTQIERISGEVGAQKSLISQIATALRGKTAGGESLPTQEKSIEITENGNVEVFPDDGYTLSKVGITVNVDSGGSSHGFLDGTLADAINSDVTKVIDYACRGRSLITAVNLPNATDIGVQAFYGCKSIESVNMPSAITVGNQCFYGCIAMNTFIAPLITTIGQYTFRECKALKVVVFQYLTSIPTYAFYNSPALEIADFGVVESIDSSAFQVCSSLTSLILRKSDIIVTLANTNALTRTPIEGGTGYIYVPSALIDTYKSATNWSTYANQFRAIEDYPEICG
jgi:hypothetical protein